MQSTQSYASRAALSEPEQLTHRDRQQALDGLSYQCLPGRVVHGNKRGAVGADDTSALIQCEQLLIGQVGDVIDGLEGQRQTIAVALAKMRVLDQPGVEDDQLQRQVLAFPGAIAVQAGGIQAATQQALGIKDRRHRAAQAEIGRQEVFFAVDDQRLSRRQGGADAVGADQRFVPAGADHQP